MGLAANNAQFLMLTRRKSDCEYNMSLISMRKMSLTREMSQLSKEYNAKLQAKDISYYENGKYNKINYKYLMGYGANYLPITNGTAALKENNSMILTDYKGQVIMSDTYADAIVSVLGNDCVDAFGKGSTFTMDNDTLADIMSNISASPITKDVYLAVLNGEQMEESYAATVVQTLTGFTVGSTTVDASSEATELVQKLIDFYKPIFTAAASNGWTTEYNSDMANSDSYVSDAIISGTFQLETVEQQGNYDDGTSLQYYITAGLVDTTSDNAKRQEIQAWYDEQKALISEKESMYDLELNMYSEELDAIKTMMESIKSLMDDAISSVFDWGSG